MKNKHRESASVAGETLRKYEKAKENAIVWGGKGGSTVKVLICLLSHLVCGHTHTDKQTEFANTQQSIAVSELFRPCWSSVSPQVITSAHLKIEITLLSYAQKQTGQSKLYSTSSLQHLSCKKKKQPSPVIVLFPFWGGEKKTLLNIPILPKRNKICGTYAKKTPACWLCKMFKCCPWKMPEKWHHSSAGKHKASAITTKKMGKTPCQEM